MKFQVTQEHIDNGRQHHGDSCAVALAINEQLPETFKHDFFAVDTDSFDFCDCIVETPPDVADFIRRFDCAKATCTPFEFELDLSELT